MAENLGRRAIKTKLLYLVSQPIQYQAPLLRLINAQEDIELKVVFERRGERGRYFDPGFYRDIEWDVPLTDGYNHAALKDVNLADEIVRADVLWLHGWQSHTMRKALSDAKHLGTPVLMRGENCDLAMPDGTGLRRWGKRRYIRSILGKCSAFLSIGTENRNYYIDRKVAPSRIFSMPYAIDNESFAARAAAATASRKNLQYKLGIDPSYPVVLFAGKLIARKRPDLLIDAVKQVSDLPTPPVLVIVGDGKMRPQLENKAPDAVFTGFINQSELPAYYDLADVFVLPSEREPWGLAVNEAMACSTAVIVSSEVGAGRDLVDDSTGAVFETGNVDALATAIRRCLNDAERLAQNARNKIASWSFDEDISGLRAAIAFVNDSNR